AALEAEKQRLETERLEALEAEKQKLEAEKQAELKAETERLAALEAEKQRFETERLAALEVEKQKLEAEKQAELKAETERLAALEAEKQRLETERLAALEAEKQRLEAEKQAALEAEKKELLNKYNSFIASADSLFSIKKYSNAIENYNNATALNSEKNYPKKQINKINSIIDKTRAQETAYNNAIALADEFFEKDSLNRALTKYQEAKNIFEKKYVNQQIEKINNRLIASENREKEYKTLLESGENLYNEKQYAAAIEKYKAAQNIFPNRDYAEQMISKSEDNISALQMQDEMFNRAISIGDSLYNKGSLISARNNYNNALGIRPETEYAKEQINIINSALLKIEGEFRKEMKAAENFFLQNDYKNALEKYQTALKIKPEEEYTKKQIRISEKRIKDEEALILKEYKKAIGIANDYYNSKKLDLALDAYRKAEEIKPDDSYANNMLTQIKKYLVEHSVVHLLKKEFLLAQNESKKFSFTTIPFRQRKNNYILLQASSPDESEPKIYISYGKDNSKNGGVVIHKIENKKPVEYIITLNNQDNWYRLDNNWIKIYSEGGNVIISDIYVAKGND
ncbi:MAG: hypothetical protein U9R32_07845, partial [Bacteroidota bacterium]|nr:hypothetical protein [Bacteroidota bacterium]